MVAATLEGEKGERLLKKQQQKVSINNPPIPNYHVVTQLFSSFYSHIASPIVFRKTGLVLKWSCDVDLAQSPERIFTKSIIGQVLQAIYGCNLGGESCTFPPLEFARTFWSVYSLDGGAIKQILSYLFQTTIGAISWRGRKMWCIKKLLIIGHRPHDSHLNIGLKIFYAEIRCTW